VRPGPPPIDTPRLRLRRPVLADIPALFAFLGDPDAMRHTHADDSLRACRRRVLVHEWRRRIDGVAPWVIATRSEERIIGWGGLYRDPFEPDWGVEVGYFLAPAAWGRGYATELVAACLDLADHGLRLPELHAFAHPDNAGSRRVLEKSGFAALRFVPEMDRLLYRRRRAAP
jgi:[ribosomal protein S5]-alanine N-acetyltransferase